MTIDFNPIDMMVDSGARGNSQQIRQIAGMKGLVSNPRGEMIPRPIKSSFREGLSVLEYFISTHGARKGLADTALRTADSGYLTRRLVDVAQELIVREDDCGIDPWHLDRERRPTSRAIGATSRPARTVACSPRAVTLADGTTFEPGTMLDDGTWRGSATTEDRPDPGAFGAHLRGDHGVCATCYGQSLATGRLIELGEAVGVIAAQSIGEPGTQLTMRTFHAGGVAE